MQQLLKAFAKHPRRLFLVDGLGALVTAVCLLIFSSGCCHTGMPRLLLMCLAAAALLFGYYSIACSLLAGLRWRRWLLLIGFANLLYCGVTAGLFIYHFRNLSALGLLYFPGEILIILLLVAVEFKTLNTAALA